jgi:hypothetical protein
MRMQVWYTGGRGGGVSAVTAAVSKRAPVNVRIVFYEQVSLYEYASSTTAFLFIFSSLSSRGGGH